MNKRDLDILIETPHYLVVNKPNGLNVERWWDYPSLEEHVYRYLQTSTRRQSPYVGIVHRLDRRVSGAIVLAKKKSVLRLLNQQLAEQKMKKTYLAVVEKELQTSKEWTTLTHHLRKDQATKKAIITTGADKRAKRACLHYRCLASSEGFACLEIRLETGRYHQIRVQLSAEGLPIVGDEKYGALTPYQKEAIMLHAWQLQFKEPKEQQLLSVQAPIPWAKEWYVRLQLESQL